MDFSDQYNSKLSPEAEASFQKWLLEQNDSQKRDVSNDLQDYDLRGFYKNRESLSENGHGSDLYKKPNHPTFSDQSMYNGANGLTGGKWSENTFEASPTNTIMHSPEELSQYFNKVEPNTQLRFQTLKNKLKR